MRPQQPHAVEYPAIEVQLSEAAKVRGRAEDARVTSDPAKRPRVLVVDFAPDHATTHGVLVLGRRDAPPQLGGWPVHRLVEV